MIFFLVSSCFAASDHSIKVRISLLAAMGDNAVSVTVYST